MLIDKLLLNYNNYINYLNYKGTYFGHADSTQFLMAFSSDKVNYFSSRMTYALPKTRTNYGIFNIRHQGAKIWNAISVNIKLLSLKQFKKKLKSNKLLPELTVQHISFLPLVNLLTYFIFLFIFAKLYF